MRLLAIRNPLFCSAAAKSLSFEDASARATQKGLVDIPPLARQLTIKGVVLVETCVSETGEVILTKPAGGSPLLVVGALDSAKKWRFQPLVEDNLIAARQYMDSEVMKKEYSKNLRSIREHYLTLLKQAGQGDLAAALERRMKDDK